MGQTWKCQVFIECGTSCATLKTNPISGHCYRSLEQIPRKVANSAFCQLHEMIQSGHWRCFQAIFRTGDTPVDSHPGLTIIHKQSWSNAEEHSIQYGIGIMGRTIMVGQLQFPRYPGKHSASISRKSSPTLKGEMWASKAWSSLILEYESGQALFQPGKLELGGPSKPGNDPGCVFPIKMSREGISADFWTAQQAELMRYLQKIIARKENLWSWVLKRIGNHFPIGRNIAKCANPNLQGVIQILNWKSRACYDQKGIAAKEALAMWHFLKKGKSPSLRIGQEGFGYKWESYP